MGIYRAVGRNIRSKREALGLTQPKLAEMTGLTVATISRLENGHQPGRKSNLEIISMHLGCTVDDLFAEPAPETQWTEPTAKELHSIVGRLLTETEQLKARIKELEAENEELGQSVDELLTWKSRAIDDGYLPSRFRMRSESSSDSESSSSDKGSSSSSSTTKRKR